MSALDLRTLDRAMRPMTQPIAACDTVDRLYTIADLLEATDKVLGRAWDGLGARETAVEACLTDYDFLMTARALRKLADTWQDALDAEAVQFPTPTPPAAPVRRVG